MTAQNKLFRKYKQKLQFFKKYKQKPFFRQNEREEKKTI